MDGHPNSSREVAGSNPVRQANIAGGVSLVGGHTEYEHSGRCVVCDADPAPYFLKDRMK